MAQKKQSSLMIIFTTVLVDLIGFGMVIPLVGLYGRHYQASGFELSVLGGIFSLMQFFFTPIWGSLSDRVGRRPIILMSLLGSTLSYIIFGLAPNYHWLLVSRAFGGIFAANISTAQAYIADVTSTQDRAKGMGLIGAAFGIGFTLGPPLGGIAAAKLGLAAPGLIAAAICGLNFILAIFRLPESFPPEKRSEKATRSLVPFRFSKLVEISKNQELAFLLLTFFLVTFAFSNMEQTFPLLFQNKFNLDTGDAGYKTGIILMASGLFGAYVQGGMIRKLVPKYGEKKLLTIGIFLNAIAMACFPFGPTYLSYFFITLPMAFGSALVNPTLSSLISKNAKQDEQGTTLGISQSLGSLARASGPFCGLLTFGIRPELPYLVATVISCILLFYCLRIFFSKKTAQK